MLTPPEEFVGKCRKLRNRIEDERKSSSFTCGGTITIQGHGGEQKEAEETSLHSSPSLNLFWKTAGKTSAEKLTLPITGTGDSTAARLQQLVQDCSPATFGVGSKDILDPDYRRAGKLDADSFASTFHPADFGILESIQQVLLPSISSDLENRLPFRKLTADLYKMNVYSGPAGLFRRHVDTPRSSKQIGSLVVCLPSEFSGGQLIVRHHGKTVSFDWSSSSGSTIQWAAFYSDCEHEIEQISTGHRITLTYNLVVSEPGYCDLPSPVVDPKSLPLYAMLKDMVAKPGALDKGGVLGVFCSHAYAHSSTTAEHSLPQILKGSDLVLYSVFKSLGLQVNVLPVREADGFYHTENPQMDIGGRTHPKRDKYAIDEYEDSLGYATKRYWPFYRLPGVFWLTEPKQEEMAFSYLAYGNESSVETMYSCAAIFAVIPPLEKRHGEKWKLLVQE
ncbi:hypothetical protein ASPZODRAFT_72321 [Penicilliopsis zonata CBS 506.65]|uniref:Fe2OG dioxygenase domain-containing protein n=1 Tax=Penicilliopsis zonata CBS 506.65 TaxID=1073090 RepID=A0A1L9S9X3_9EURO|nr:hypothetical protein ASPZODRAFT_72321 [Penicilliopsis zonata CBS 506.65]OJJ43939.1 hypothetical protein ASPZODRAFT_72321 [Penicilliopsis zonata CBS 506.65]